MVSRFAIFSPNNYRWRGPTETGRHARKSADLGISLSRFGATFRRRNRRRPKNDRHVSRQAGTRVPGSNRYYLATPTWIVVKKEHPSELIDAGRELLSSVDFSVRDNMYDYDLHTIANVCLRGAEGSATAQLLCEQIKQGLSDHTFRPYNFDHLLQSIFELKPPIALDVFFAREPQADSSPFDGINFDRIPYHQRNPLDGVPIEDLIRWCDERPAKRYPTLSHLVSYHTATEAGVKWTPIAIDMLKRRLIR